MNALAVTLPPSFPPLPHSSHESFNHFSIVYILKNFSLHKSKFCGILNISTKMHRKVGVFKIHGENSFVQFLKSRSNRSSSSHFGTMSGSGPFQQAIICFIPFCLRFKFWQQLQPQTYPSSPRHFRSTSLAHFPEFFCAQFFFLIVCTVHARSMFNPNFHFQYQPLGASRPMAGIENGNSG